MIKYPENLENPMAKILLSNLASGYSVLVEMISSVYNFTWDYGKKNKTSIFYYFSSSSIISILELMRARYIN